MGVNDTYKTERVDKRNCYSFVPQVIISLGTVRNSLGFSWDYQCTLHVLIHFMYEEMSRCIRKFSLLVDFAAV